MYLEFYGLQRAPFDLAPDPTFFFQSASHLEALANLCYGVGSRKGFIVLTGEVGTGKSLLVRHLMTSLSRRNVRCSHVFNPRLSTTELLQYVLSDFGVDRELPTSKVQLLMRLNDFLLERYRVGSTAVLIVDEAHLLDWELLEEIRLLTNLETADQKLLQIILAGQPELDRNLDSHDLRQLKQRVALRCRLKTLNAQQTIAYIRQRMQRAGTNAAAEIFPEPTIDRVFMYSRGIPRLINLICENALISGCAQRLLIVPLEVIDEVADDFRLNASVTETDLMPTVPRFQSVTSRHLRPIAR
jgi:type II secretory pathway predicted ATPase ExeA